MKDPDFSGVLCKKTGGSGHRLKYRKLPLNRIIYLLNHCNSDETLEHAAQRIVESSTLEVFKASQSVLSSLLFLTLL